MPLSNAEKQRRYRERKKAEQEARERYDRGLAPKAPEPEAPEGAYLTSTGFARPKFGQYAAQDGTFPAIPQDIHDETYTKPDGTEELVPEQFARFLARQREGAAPTDDRSVLFE